MRYHLSALLAVLVLVHFDVSAQTDDKRWPIHVSAQCDDDTVGQRLVYKTREEIRKSNRLSEADGYLSSVLQLQFICVDPKADEAGTVSRYSYAITAFNSEGTYDYFITSGVGSCGSSRVAECAEGRVANVDEALDDLIKRFRDGTFKFQPKE